MRAFKQGLLITKRMLRVGSYWYALYDPHLHYLSNKLGSFSVFNGGGVKPKDCLLHNADITRKYDLHQLK